MVGRENSIPKGSVSIAGAGFTGPFHTSPTNAATFASKGFGGYTRHPSS
jgi:uridylate kinase